MTERDTTPAAGERSGATMRDLSTLIESCQRGDPDALQLFFETYRDDVFTMALGLCGDDSLAGDIAQEVFLKVITRIRQFRFEAELTTWLYRIVVNTFLDLRRSRRREQLGFEDLLLARDATQHSDLERRETAAIVRAAIATLAPKLRMPLVLRYTGGRSYDEIGAILGIAPGTVASRLSRAHAALAEKLAPVVNR